jgi:hypothetical protein
MRRPVQNQLSHGLARSWGIEDALHTVTRRHIGPLGSRDSANQGQPIRSHGAEARLAGEDRGSRQDRGHAIAKCFQPVDRSIIGGDEARI